jgi:hypothetical protein
VVVQFFWHCATRRKSAGSIRDGIIGIFYLHKPYGDIVVMGSTQLPTELSTSKLGEGES